MSRLVVLNPEEVSEPTQTLFESAKKTMGRIPNMVKMMGNSAAVLESYLNFSSAMHRALDPKLREQIALLVSELNACGYCLAAHSAVSRHLGLSAQQITESRTASADDPKIASALVFTREVVQKRGHVTDDDLDAIRGSGFSDGEIVEIIAEIVLSTFTNYINIVAQTELDFPAIAAVEPQ